MQTQQLSPGCLIPSFIIGSLIGLGIGLLFPYFLCDINPEINAGWLRGWWHGGNAIGNYILSLFLECRIAKAPIHSGAYNFFWWISIIGSGFIWLFYIIHMVRTMRNILSGDQ